MSNDQRESPARDGASGAEDVEGQTPLPAGKIPSSLLADLISCLPIQDSRLLLGPAVGEDAAVIDLAPDRVEVLVVKSDPVTFATDEIGYYAVNICANDLAVTGASPTFYLPTILLPAAGATARMASQIFAQIGAACRRLGVVVAGGHSEISPTVNQPIVAGTMLGIARRDTFVRTGGCRPGDLVLLAGVVPIEGTSIIAREKRDELLARGRSPAVLSKAAAFLHRPGISVLAAARLALQSGAVSAMHDPTEGGIATGLLELATAAGIGLEIDLDTIPIPDLARQLCADVGLDPLGTIASGALLVSVRAEAAPDLLQRWREQGISGAIIGRATEAAAGLIALRDGRRGEFPRFQVDEIARLWSR